MTAEDKDNVFGVGYKLQGSEERPLWHTTTDWVEFGLPAAEGEGLSAIGEVGVKPREACVCNNKAFI